MIKHIQFSISRNLIHLALFILPKGQVKTDLYKILENYSKHIIKTIDKHNKEKMDEYSPKGINYN